jgi:hypothetical protein
VSSVLDHDHSVADALQRLEVRGKAGETDGGDGARPLPDLGDRRRGVEIPGRSVDVDEAGARTLIERAVGCPREGERRNEQLVPRPEPCGEGCAVERGGAVGEGDGVPRPEVLGQRLLEAVDRRSLRNQGRLERLRDRSDVLLGDVLSSVRKESIAQRAALTSDAISRSWSTSSQWSFWSLE